MCSMCNVRACMCAVCMRVHERVHVRVSVQCTRMRFTNLSNNRFDRIVNVLPLETSFFALCSIPFINPE